MLKVLLFLHQLPQNLLGLLVILFTRASKSADGSYWLTHCSRWGVSLGSFIIFSDPYSSWVPGTTVLKHEQGHQKQSLYLGWLYLIVVGLPSVCVNLWDRFFHRGWRVVERLCWYYSRYPEHWADSLGGVERDYTWIL